MALGYVSLHFDRSHGRRRRAMPGSVATIFSVGRLRQGDVQDPKISEADSQEGAMIDDMNYYELI